MNGRHNTYHSLTAALPGYLPIRDAAAWAGVSSKTVRRWMKQGLPFRQAGTRAKVLIRPADIDRFLDEKQVPQVDLISLVDEVMQNLGTSTTKRKTDGW